MTRILTLALTGMLAMAANFADADSAAAKDVYVIATGSTGGTSYFVGSAMAQVVNRHSPNLQIEVLPTSGTTESAAMVARGKAHITLLTPSAAINAYKGSGPFEGNALPDLRQAWGGYYNYHNFIAPVRSGITTWEDLKGKRVGMCPQATTCTQIAEATLAAAGLSVDDIEPQYLSFNEQADALADRKLDAAAMFGGLPGAAILNITSRADVVFLPLTEEMQEKIHQTNSGFVPVTLPADSYPKQTEPVLSVGTAVLFATGASVPDEVLAEMTDILYANGEELLSIMPLMRFFTADNELTRANPIIPRHSGLENHLKEIGVLK